MANIIPDQKKLWDRKHQEGEHESFRGEPSPFAQLTNSYLKPKSKILELGCGVGRDAVFFAENGNEVVATDFSRAIINRNKKEFKLSNIRFDLLDMEQPFPLHDAIFDAVYANLSLHYYTDAKTKTIVQEITRVLKPDGIFAFACKSTSDYHYGKGEELEENFFVSSNGHARHLFTEPYAKKLIQSSYELVHLTEVEEIYAGQVSAMIQCIARKKGE